MIEVCEGALELCLAQHRQH